MKTHKNKYPLKKIISEEVSSFGTIVETLECGHKQNKLTDIYGPTNAYRRRCRRCFKAKHAPVL